MAHQRRDEELCKKILVQCYSNIHCEDGQQVKKLFNFNDDVLYDNSSTPSIANWTNYFPSYLDKNGFVLDTMVNQLTDYGNTTQVPNYFSREESIQPSHYLADIIALLSDRDESLTSKIPPIPAIRAMDLCKNIFVLNLKTLEDKEQSNIKKRFCEKYQVKTFEDALSLAFIVALQEIIEDGGANTTIYAEYDMNAGTYEGNFVCFSGLQYGELSIHVAHWLMKMEFGGWSIVNKLRSIFIQAYFEDENDTIYDTLLEKTLKHELKNHFEDNKIELLLNKIQRLFKNVKFRAYTAKTMSGYPIDSDRNVQVIFDILHQFEKNYVRAKVYESINLQEK